MAGASRALLETASRTLLQRSVPAQLLGRVFGVLEGMMMAGLALGALLVSLLVHLGGSRLALLGVEAMLPLAAAGGRGLVTLDAEAPVPVVQIALLRSIPLFAELPAPAIEGLAVALTPAELPAGAILIRQGDPGDAYHGSPPVSSISSRTATSCAGAGAATVWERSHCCTTSRAPRPSPHTPATVYRLNREPFLTAVLGHAPTHQQAGRIAHTRLATGTATGNDTPGTGTVERN